MPTLEDYMNAGYNLEGSACPPYPSSTVYMAFMAGKWCRFNHITPKEIKPGRGYKMIVNRTFSLDFKHDNNIPNVERITA
jgi:hypothetical protein